MCPIFFRIPFLGIPVHAYGVMVALGMLLGIWVTVLRARQAGVDPEVFYDMGLWSMVSGILGARMLYVYTNWDEFRDVPLDILKIWKGGQILYGGLILAVVVNLWFLKRRNLPVLKIADLAAPALPLGIAVGRIGCFLNGCCEGNVAAPSFPFAVRFPEGSPAFSEQLRQGLIQPDGLMRPVHPSQIYATLIGLMLYVVLSWFYQRRRWEGQVLSLTLMGYALARILEEHFRGDTVSTPRFWGALKLNPGQYVSVWVLVAGLFCYLFWGVQGRKKLQDL